MKKLNNNKMSQQAQEVYFNREEMDLFRKSQNNGHHCEVEKGVNFSLPNSFETFETASFLQKVRLTTLDSLRADSEQGDSGVCSVNASVNGELEEILFSDDNGQERRETLEHYFSEWRALFDIRWAISLNLNGIFKGLKSTALKNACVRVFVRTLSLKYE